MNICIRRKCLQTNWVGSLYRLSTATAEVTEGSDQALIDDSDEARAREAHIEEKRNISRLSAAHHNLINGRRPYEVPKSLAHMTVKYHRKMYGKFGIESGINPSLCWPTKKDIAEKLEYEAVAYPFTIKQMMETAAHKREQEQQKILERDRDISAKFAKLAQWKKELDDKIAKKAADVLAAKEKKERLVEEVRRHFGFKLDPRDERFQEMLAKREKEQKKQEKMVKKEAKEKAMLAKLQQKNVQIKSDGTIVTPN